MSEHEKKHVPGNHGSESRGFSGAMHSSESFPHAGAKQGSDKAGLPPDFAGRKPFDAFPRENSRFAGERTNGHALPPYTAPALKGVGLEAAQGNGLPRPSVQAFAETQPVPAPEPPPRNNGRLHSVETVSEGIVSSDAYKKQLVTYGFFSGLLVLLFTLLVVFSLFSQKRWDEGLKQPLKAALSQSFYREYTLSSPVLLTVPFAASCAGYVLISPTGTQNYYGIVVRCTTMYGPFAAVFVYDVNHGTAEFIDYAQLDGKARSAIVNASRNSQLRYWEKKIPAIMKNSHVAKGK